MMSVARPVIIAYCLDWHITTSSAFMELLVKPLAPYADIRLTAWDGKQDLPNPLPDIPTIFCQMPPTSHWLVHNRTAPIIWIPMADYRAFPEGIQNHPSVRVVAFSDMVMNWAIELGLSYLRLTYALNPQAFQPANFDGERVLLYWNRTGLFHKGFLLRLCRALQVDRLIFRSALDPRVDDRQAYHLPDKIGNMVIETHPTLTGYADYMALLRRANMFIAPRWREGVGIALLEAMASGCFVMGYDDETMNTYIQHDKNGIIFSDIGDKPLLRFAEKFVHRFFQIFHRRWMYRVHGIHVQYPALTVFQDWRHLKQVDIAQFGAQARLSMSNGYAKWIATIPTYAEFVLKKTE